MASPSLSSDPKTAVMGYPSPHPPPSGHQPDKHTTDLPQHPYAGRSDPQPPCRRMTYDWKSELRELGVIYAAILASFMLIWISVYFFSVLNGPGNPVIKVAALTVSNLTVSASARPSWKASLSVKKSEDFGSLFFREVECVAYYQWDEAQPLGLASVEPFVLRSKDTTVIKATINMERLAEAAVMDINRERRAIGTVAIGLGLRMQATYVLRSWWKRDYGRIEAYCDGLRIAFPDSKGEGSLITRDTGRSCSYNPVDPRDTF